MIVRMVRDGKLGIAAKEVVNRTHKHDVGVYHGELGVLRELPNKQLGFFERCLSVYLLGLCAFFID